MPKPVSLVTVGAPIGWHIKKGHTGKILAHFYWGGDGQVYGFRMDGPKPQPMGPWPTKDEAREAITDALLKSLAAEESRRGR